MDNLEVQRMPALDSLTLVCGIIGSCNGLLYVLLGYNEHGSPPSLLLLNPATRETRKVPRTTHDDGGYGIFRWGFGFSPVDKDYRIVRIHNAKFYIYNIRIKFDNFYVAGVEAYSLRTGSWKEVEFGVIKSVRLQSKPVTANGSIFWLGLEGGDHRPKIVSFDLAMEVFTLIPIPSSISDDSTYLSELNLYENQLAVLHGHYAHKSSFIDLWMLEEGSGAFGKSLVWTKKYSIGPTSCSLYPICFWKNEIVCQNFESERNCMLKDCLAFHLFNLTTNNELKKFHISLSANNLNGTFNYAESLVSICEL